MGHVGQNTTLCDGLIATSWCLHAEGMRGQNVRMLSYFRGDSLPLPICTERDLINRYNHYLAVDMMASSEEEHRAWVGWVESRLRKVISEAFLCPFSLVRLCDHFESQPIKSKSVGETLS